jgi:ribosomal protein S18 acetylase RimI-like enzyme
MTVNIILADYHNPQHAAAIVELLDGYARDPMGGNEALSDGCKANLVAELAKIDGAFTLLAFIDGIPAGLANCFMGFSTFACKKLINIHDIAVDGRYRKRGVSQRLLQAVEVIGRERDCCKITLEVLSGNEAAKLAYRKFGFSDYQLDPDSGHALFWQKKLD